MWIKFPGYYGYKTDSDHLQISRMICMVILCSPDTDALLIVPALWFSCLKHGKALFSHQSDNVT